MAKREYCRMNPTDALANRPLPYLKRFGLDKGQPWGVGSGACLLGFNTGLPRVQQKRNPSDWAQACKPTERATSTQPWSSVDLAAAALLARLS